MGICRPDGGLGRDWNDKGAWRMKFGMRVWGGLRAALVMFAVVGAASLAATIVSTPAAAQSASEPAPAENVPPAE